MSSYAPTPQHQTAPQGSYVVIRVADVERSAQFYRSLGLELTREKHGEGPVHFSFQLSPEVVCELYPLKNGVEPSTPQVRLGFRVDDLESLRANLVSAGSSIVAGATDDSFIVLDPSGNQVEISRR